MRKIKRIISTLLTVCLLLGSLSGLFTVNLFAAETEIDLSSIDYTKEVYHTAEEKLATMTMRFEKGDHQIWINEYTGEVAVVNTKSGEKLFTNPYDVGLSSAADSVKAEMLSQIIISYTGNELSGTNTFTSYTDAVLNNQIKVKSIKNGVRVEYTLGREESKVLVPRLITKERFETLILQPVTEGITNLFEERAKAEGRTEAWVETQVKFELGKFTNFFQLSDPEAEPYKGSDYMLAQLYNQYPVISKVGAIYAIGSETTSTELIRLEETIKTYCPSYTFEELEIDHAQTEYVGEDQNPAVFKLSLEYTLDDLGLSVTLPANGIRFDESLYQLSSITMLPFMGASLYSATMPNTGYTFLPDGAGAIFRFEDLVAGQTIKGNFYGLDYAYHSIVGKNQETLRMPVYGLVRDNLYSYAQDEETGSYSIVKNENPTSSGFFAIMEEGDALSSISSYHMGGRGEYHTLQLTVNPRPSDTYNVADAISVGQSSSWTVVSDRKYVGNYKVRYILLTDDKVAAEKGLADTYSASYLGMAKAYRDYLTSPYSTGTQNESAENQSTILTRLDSNKVESTIPLYLETFGTMETVEKVLSIPVNVMTPLTTFDNIRQIYEDLSQESVGITNINFKLTGYANGGLYSTMPYNLKWEKAVGGAKGFESLMQFAESVNAASPTDGNHLGIFPDFDFANVTMDSMFDGFTLSKHAVKTIDDRYTTKRTYSATYQTLESIGSLVVSPAYFSHFYDKLATNYLKYSLAENGSDLGISVATLGTDLNSDFDEDEPYNREDSKQFTIDAFKSLSETYGNVMTSGGNAYVWQYVDYILGLPIDGSRYLASSNSVPFIGIVLHGFKQYSGNPINMEGNIQYGLLKAIENGASLYFILTYDNATELKEDYYYSKYYSVRYDIWAGSYNEDGVFEEGELVEIYNSLNDVTKDLQTKIIINHELLSGQRIPDADEVEADLRAEEEARKLAEEQAAAAADAKFRAELLEARVSAVSTAQIAVDSATAKLPKETAFAVTLSNIQRQVELIRTAEKALELTPDDETQQATITAAKKEIDRLFANFMTSYNSIKQSSATVEDKIRIVETAVNYFTTSGIYSQQFIDDAAQYVEQIHEVADAMKAVMEAADSNLAQVLAAADGFAVVAEEEKPEEEVVAESKINERYLIDDGSIVAVTYGEEDDPYRTFLLNYNYFTISVEYNGTQYEIERYGYVLIDHEA